MKRIIFTIIATLSLLPLLARELKVESLHLLPNDNTAQITPVKDLNGDDCALVKVKTDLAGCVFDNAIGDVKYQNGAYNVYLSPGTRRLGVKCNDHENLTVDFNSVSGISALESSDTYELTLTSHDNSKELGLVNLIGNDSLTIVGLELLPSDLSARTNERRDETGQRCALIKVAIPLPNCSFSGINGEAIYKVNEYDVYLSPMAKEFIIYCPGFGRTVVSLGSLDHDRLESGATYRLKVSGYNVSMVDFTSDFKNLLQRYDGIEDFDNGVSIVNIGNKYGVINIHGKEIIPVIYDKIYIYDFDGGFVEVKKDNKVGRFNFDGTTILSCKYDAIRGSSVQGHYWVCNDGKWGYYGENDQEIFPCKYDNVNRNGGFVDVYQMKRKGLFNELSGKEILPCEYSFISNKRDDNNIIVTRESGYGITSQDGIEILPCKYEDITNLYADGYSIKNNSKVALYDSKNKRIIIPFGQYDYYGALGNDLIKNSKKGIIQKGKEISLYGCLDNTGKVIVPCKYNAIETFKNGLSKIKKDNKYGAINKNGIEVITPVYEEIRRIDPQLIVAKKDGKYGLLNHRGQVVVNFDYDKIESNYDENEPAYSDGNNGYHTKIGDKCGYLNSKGEQVIPCHYDVIRRGVDMLFVKENGKWGLFSLEGKQIMPFKYDRIYWFVNDMAVVENDGKHGFIDRSGREILPCKFNYISHFSNEGIAISEKETNSGTKQAIVDIHGNNLTPFKYDHIDCYDDTGTPIVSGDVIYVTNNGLQGFVNLEGTELVPCLYESASYNGSNAFVVCKDGKFGVINQYGTELIPFKYEEMSDFKSGISRVKLDGKTGFVNIKGEEVWFKN